MNLVYKSICNTWRFAHFDDIVFQPRRRKFRHVTLSGEIGRCEINFESNRASLVPTVAELNNFPRELAFSSRYQMKWALARSATFEERIKLYFSFYWTVRRLELVPIKTDGCSVHFHFVLARCYSDFVQNVDLLCFVFSWS